ncbi:ATP-binding protein [Brevundimonas lutea]|uniref:ATP-binding protein n=1 Tax=Brevundimonas lutea TaxID=2293980 RepID=UPI001F0BCA51|nr:ATP-binding protein [Brevundimonas lutea]
MTGAVEGLSTGRTPRLVTATLAALVLGGLVLAVMSERHYRDQKVREAQVQAEILAASVAAPLAFDDADTAQAYVRAMARNPEVLSVGVYDERGERVAHLSRDGASPPAPRLQAGETPSREGSVRVASPVVEAGARLGQVRLEMGSEPVARRLARYGGVALLIGMAALAMIVLGAAQAALRRANGELGRQAQDLAGANARLHTEMEERARAEEALRQSQKMEALGQLTGGIAHDFNNLLMITSGGLDLLDRTSDPKKRDRLKAGIRQAVDRGAGLTRQLLAFSRRSALKPEVVDLGARIEGMRLLLERSLREDIEVTFDAPADLWPVEVDAGELEVALINLAVNARDAMPAGGRLVVSARNVPGEPTSSFPLDHVCLAVTDTGVGMSPEVVERVFEPFFTTKGVGSGTGLGLSQVYGFARSSGGRTDINSRPGEGTRISLCLPKSARSAGEAPADAEAAAPLLDEGGRLLLVEDDDGVAAVVIQMVQDLGLSARRAMSAEEAIAVLAEDQAFRLVFSDMVMPGTLDGRQLAQHVRDHYPHLPVLLTTGFSQAAEAARSEGLSLLPKPYRLPELRAALEQALRPKN